MIIRQELVILNIYYTETDKHLYLYHYFMEEQTLQSLNCDLRVLFDSMFSFSDEQEICWISYYRVQPWLIA